MIPESWAATVRIKDIAKPEFERENPLIGYGLVVGLNGTGDDTSKLSTAAAIQQYQSLLSEFGRGLRIDLNEVETKNSAIVIVTADLPPYTRAGSRVPVTVSSQFDAESLQGGTLLATALRGFDGKVYAMAQGEVIVGGYSIAARGGGGPGTQENHPTVGSIPNGAIVERNANFLREFDRERLNKGFVNFILKNPDFTQALNVQNSINQSFHLRKMARALDPGTVEVNLNGLMERYEYNSPMELIAEIEKLELNTDLPARVIVSERTGVVIAGSDAKLSAVEIVHGDLRVVVTPAEPDQYIEELGTAQVTEIGGEIRPGRIRTIEGRGQQIEATEEDPSLVQLEEGDTVGNLVQAISGPLAQKSPRDIISILQALDRMGALHAELILVGD
jgi:flagellar P-ring protein precursor FlgI